MVTLVTLSVFAIFAVVDYGGGTIGADDESPIGEAADGTRGPRGAIKTAETIVATTKEEPREGCYEGDSYDEF